MTIYDYFNEYMKIIKHFWNIRVQFARYFITGISGTLIDIGTLFVFANIFNIKPVIGVILNQAIIICYLFLLNKYWTFKNKHQTKQQLVRFVLVMGLNYLIAVIWMSFWNESLGYNYLLVRVVNIALSVGWNFLIYKHWVYKKSVEIEQKHG